MFRFPLALTSFIAANPGFVAWVLGGLLTFIAAIISVYHGVLLNRHSNNAKAIEELGRRLSLVELAVVEHRAEVKRAQEEFNDLSATLREHMGREEHEVWGGIRGLGERMARIEGQLDSIRKQMPNGDMAEVLTILRRMARAQG